MNALKILAYGGQVTAIGLLIVFTGLILLIACIVIMGKIFQAVTGAGKNKSADIAVKEAPPVKAAEPEPAPAAQEAEPDTGIDPQVIAVIAAAIAAYDTNRNLVVRSVRRVGGWRKAARDEAISRF